MLTRLVVATLYTFGLKRGVGLDTISEFFARLHLAAQVGCSASALRGVMETLEAALLETTAAWEQAGRACGEVREIIGAVDETFLERMLLVFMDLSTGYLLLEEVAEDRTYATWHTLVDARLQTLGPHVLSLVSDQAKALIQLAEQGLECLSMPDFFHVVHDIVKSYSLAMGRHLSQARQDLRKAQEALARHPGEPQVAHDAPEAQALVEARQAEVQRWEEVQCTYRHHLETLSLTLHLFRLADSTPQTSSVTSTSACHAEGPQADPCPGGPGGLLVARGVSRCRALRPIAVLETMGARGAPAASLLGTSCCPDSLSAQKGEVRAGTGDSPRRV